MNLDINATTSYDLREVMVSKLMDYADQGEDIIVLVSDSTSTAKIAPFQKQYAQNVINVGIAEQSLVGVAAGLAKEGHMVFTANAAPFLISRANEQIKIDVCYNKAPVKMIGLNAGVAYGALGSSHHAIDDISVMRGFGNVDIYCPADPVETVQILDHVKSLNRPAYIRINSVKTPILHKDDYQFTPGEPHIYNFGENIAMVTAGSLCAEAVKAVCQLKEEGVNPTLVGLPSLRPLNYSRLEDILSKHKIVITYEEHSVNGGIGSIIAELLAEVGINARLIRRGISSGEFAKCGPQQQIWKHYGLDEDSMVKAAQSLS